LEGKKKGEKCQEIDLILIKVLDENDKDLREIF
jgi:hypothetical protein